MIPDPFHQQHVRPLAEVEVALEARHRYVERKYRALRRREGEFSERRAIEDAGDVQANALASDFAAALQR